MTDFLNATLFTATFTALIAIPSPFGTILVLPELTSRMTPEGQKQAALQATTVSISVILTSMILDQQILHLLHISMGALRLSDGVLFFPVTTGSLMGSDSKESDTDDERVNVTPIPLGTPLSTGPDTTTAVVVPVTQAGNSITSWIGLVCAVTITHLIIQATMHSPLILSRLLGPGGVMLLAKIMGLLFAMIVIGLAVGRIFNFIAAT